MKKHKRSTSEMKEELHDKALKIQAATPPEMVDLN